MEKQDMFEVLKGNVKFINLNDIIKQHKDAFIDWITPYYTEKDKKQMQGLFDIFRLDTRRAQDDRYIAARLVEPNWKPGQKRKMSQIWKRKQDTINQLWEIQEKLLDLTYPDSHYDRDNNYEITITAKKVALTKSEEA